MKQFSNLALALIVAVANPLPARAASDQTQARTTPATVDMTDAEVRKVDKENRKITLKHGEIKNLDMPPMTMVFQVSDPALLERLKAGDKVRFKADKIGGAYTVTAIELAP